MRKTDTDIKTCIEKIIEKLSKNGPQTSKKHGKSKNGQKIIKQSE